MKSNQTRYLVYLSVFICLNIVLTRIASIRINFGGVELVRFGIGAFPVFFAGLALGPTAGAIVGAVGDVIGYQLSSMGLYMPCFTFTAALSGCFPAFLIKKFKLKINFWSLAGVVAVSQLIISLGLVPFFLNLFFHLPYAVIIPGRIISSFLTIPVYSYLSITLMKRTILGNFFASFGQKKEIIRHKA